MKKFILIALISVSQFAFSQSRGTVTGTVTDKEMNGEPLPFANVFIKGTSIGGTTDMEGKYTIAVPAGKHTLVFSFVGYETVEKPITVKAGETTTINQQVGASEGVALKEVQVNATVSKEKESALLLEQKKATVIKESIGAVELAKKGVSNAAAATTKVSGIAKQEGSNKIYVRGLGDRYNSTTLNGLPLPSNDPEYKNISLELFTTDIIQNVGISKTFSSNLTGDVSGANIDISTKEFSGKPGLKVGVSFGGNTQTTGRYFKTIDGANWFGVAKNTKHPVKNLEVLPFTDKFTPNNDRAALNTGLSLSGGKKFEIGESSSLSMFLVGSFNNNYLKREGLSINFLRDKNSKGTSYPKALEYNYSNSKLVMGNFIYKINSKNKISYTPLFIHSNSQKIQDYTGTKPDVADSEGESANIVLQTQNQNKLLVNQLLSEHKIGESIDLNLGVSYNNVKNDEPNRKKNFFKTINGFTTFSSGTPRNNGRYFHNLNENDLTGKLEVTKYFGTRVSDEHKVRLNLGYTFRNTKRLFKAYYFDYDIKGTGLEVDPNNVDVILNQEGLVKGLFRITTAFGFNEKALQPSFYDAVRTIHSPYASIDYQVSEKLFFNLGLRYDKIGMDVSWLTAQRRNGGSAQLNRNFFLPSLNVKYTINDKNLIRLSASKTYTYPQFKEIAPFPYEAVNYISIGNENLKPSNNYNVDLKWEMYPTRSELISATVFGKIIKNSINRVETVAASEGIFSYFNTGDSKVYGGEIELRKNIWDLAGENAEHDEKIKLGLNASYMYTNQTFNRTKEFDPTNNDESLEGAAPLLINADVTYNHKLDDKETIASLVFNFQDEKLYSIGTVNKLQSLYQESLPRLDFILKRQFSKQLGIKLSAKNLLNPEFNTYRDVPSKPINRSYRNGINLSVGISYKI